MRKIDKYTVNTGKALVINIRKFQEKRHKERLGSDMDVKNLKSVLGKLKFDVTVKSNLTKKEITENVKKFVEELNDIPVDISFVCIMSHGDKDIMISHDNLEINLEEDILEKFSNSNCAKMREQPKIFLFQSCRGGNIETMRDDAQQPSEPRGTYTSTLRHAIIAYSTVPGFVALRQQDGTWFIKAFCMVFGQADDNMEVQQLFKLVSLEISEMHNNKQEKQTMEVTYRCFEKDLFFKTTDSKDPSSLLQDSSQPPHTIPDSSEQPTSSNCIVAFFWFVFELLQCRKGNPSTITELPDEEKHLLNEDSQPNHLNKPLPFDLFRTKEKWKNQAQTGYNVAWDRFNQDRTEENKEELEKAWNVFKKAWEELLDMKETIDIVTGMIRHDAFIEIDDEHRERIKTFIQ